LGSGLKMAHPSPLDQVAPFGDLTPTRVTQALTDGLATPFLAPAAATVGVAYTGCAATTGLGAITTAAAAGKFAYDFNHWFGVHPDESKSSR
jgi:hypothetical protein